jgi:hypothetical protein
MGQKHATGDKKAERELRIGEYRRVMKELLADGGNLCRSFDAGLRRGNGWESHRALFPVRGRICDALMKENDRGVVGHVRQSEVRIHHSILI